MIVDAKIFRIIFSHMDTTLCSRQLCMSYKTKFRHISSASKCFGEIGRMFISLYSYIFPTFSLDTYSWIWPRITIKMNYYSFQSTSMNGSRKGLHQVCIKLLIIIPLSVKYKVRLGKELIKVVRVYSSYN